MISLLCFFSTSDPHEVSPGDLLKLQSYGYTYHTAGQTSSVTWFLTATDNDYVLLRFANLAITPNDTLCVGEGNNPQNASSTITCISAFLSLVPWGYSEYELRDVYASVLAPPASNGLWVSFDTVSLDTGFEYGGSGFQIFASAVSEIDGLYALRHLFSRKETQLFPYI